MKVYVINKHGRPLMPTTPRKARLLLKSGKAKIAGRDPFTIQLIYGSSGYTQPTDLGIDAFVIAGGTKQSRTSSPLMLEQIRHNKRSLEQFYDAKYRDKRDGEIRSGSELSSGRRTRNVKLAGENLRQYRAHKITKGRRAIKKKRYPYRQHDIVLFEGKAYQVVGMQNLGTRLSLKPDKDCKTKYKTAAFNKVKPLKRRGGICEQQF